MFFQEPVACLGQEDIRCDFIFRSEMEDSASCRALHRKTKQQNVITLRGWVKSELLCIDFKQNLIVIIDHIILLFHKSLLLKQITEQIVLKIKKLTELAA